MLWSLLSLLTTVLTYIAVLLTLMWFWYQWTHRDMLRVARKFPLVVPAWPVIGHLLLLVNFGRENVASNILKVALIGIKKRIKTYALWIGPIPSITLLHIDDIQTFLTNSNSTDKADEYGYFDNGVEPVGNGLLMAPGNIWRITRKHFNPLFHMRNVQHLVQLFNLNSRELVSNLSEHVDNGPVNSMTHTMDVSLKTICNLIFGPGVDIDLKSSEFQGLKSIVDLIPELFMKRLMYPWLRVDAVFRFIFRKELTEINTSWNNFTDAKIELAKEISRRKNIKECPTDDSDEVPQIIQCEEPLNIVDTFRILQKNYPQFTDAHLRNEMLTLYCTGTDTVGSGTAACFLILAHYTEIQERLYREISAAVGPDDDVTVEDLNRMPYLEHVIKETLRWTLIVPYVMRKTSKDITISTCTIPAGTSVAVCLAGIHMDPTLYPNPEKFDPDRFSPENSSGKERFSYIPFSGGPRNCIAVAMLWSLLSLLTTVLTYTAVLLTLMWCWFQWTHRDMLRVARKFPLVVPAWPVIGHLPLLVSFGRENVASNVLNMSLIGIKKRIKTYAVWIGPLPSITLLHIDDIQMFLTNSNSTDKADEYGYFDSGVEPISNGLLMAPGHIWRITRKHFNPLFHMRNVQHLIMLFNLNSRELVSTLSEHVDLGPVNVMTHTMDVGLKTICNLLFGPGVDIDMKSSEFQGLMSIVELIPELFIKRVMYPWLRIDAVFRFIFRKELNEINANWNNFTDAKLELAKEISRQKNIKECLTDDNNEASESIQCEERLNIVDTFLILQKNHPQFTDAHLRSEMLTLYCTGTDTVGSGSAACFLILAHFTEIQERLYREISAAVGPDDDVTVEDLNRMPYLEQVIKETLRWTLIVPYVMRKTSNDITISTCTIPAGTSVSVCLAGIHMDPTLYPNPEKFDPDRFSPENSSGKERFSYIPFSGGPRNCIAKTYAMLLMKIMIVHVVRQYKLRTEMDIFNLRKKMIVTLVNSGGYNISLERRS